MLYHHALGYSPEWISETLDDMAAETEKPLIPFVQVDAFSAEDEPFSSREWEEIVHKVLSHDRTSGLIAFTGDMLHIRERGRSLANLLGRGIAARRQA